MLRRLAHGQHGMSQATGSQGLSKRTQLLMCHAKRSDLTSSESSNALRGQIPSPSSAPQRAPTSAAIKSNPITQLAQQEAQQLPLRLAQQQQQLDVASPQFLAASVAAFAIITADVFGPHSLHLLPQLDQQIHLLVTSHTDPTWRRQVADLAVSNTFISAGMAGWFASTAGLLIKRRVKALPALAAAWGVYCYGAGAVLVDPLLVATIKGTFQRVRPSTLHHTFSFPSGHTTAAVFTVGALLLVLLPLLLEQEQQEQQEQGNEGISASANGSTWLQTAQQQALALVQQVAVPLWIAAGVTTASGRVLADAHWTSDTLAGAAVGSACVSALAISVRQLRRAGL